MAVKVSDRFSDLPEHVQHHILSFMTAKDVIRTGILSKTFLYVSKSSPVLDFDLTYLQSEKTADELLNYVNARCSQYLGTSVLQKFGLRLVGPLLNDGLLDWAVSFAVNKRVKDLFLNLCPGDDRIPLPSPPTIAFSKCITKLSLHCFELENISVLIRGCPLLEELDLNTCILEDFEFSSDAIKLINLKHCYGLKQFKIDSASIETFCFCTIEDVRFCGIRYDPLVDDSLVNASVCKFLNLKVLSMEFSTLNDRWLQQVVSRLVYLESIKLRHCNNLENFKVSHDNLRMVHLDSCMTLDVIEVRAINLEYFCYYGGFADTRSASVNISACKNLKQLHLSGVRMSGDIISACKNLKQLRLGCVPFPGYFFHEQLSTFHELVNLDLSLASFSGMVLINLQNLKSLSIDNPDSANFNINAPRLASFTYDGNHLNPFKSLHYSSTLKATLNVQPPRRRDISYSYYLQWLEFLQLFGLCKVLEISCPHDEVLVFPQEIRETRFAPLVNLKHMIVELDDQKTISPELVDSLLWLSPYLETLAFRSFRMEEPLLSIKFDYDSTMSKYDREICLPDISLEVSTATTTFEEMEIYVAVNAKDNLLEYFKGKAKSVKWK